MSILRDKRHKFIKAIGYKQYQEIRTTFLKEHGRAGLADALEAERLKFEKINDR